MHRIPKIFSHSSDSSKSGLDSSFGGSRHGPKPRRRLDRRNAAKNIDYDFSPCSSSASSSYSSEESLRTRSLDLYGGKTSFRIEGIDGEVEIMCQTLGFAGIDDFTISAEEYEAMKVRCFSSPLVFNQMNEPIINKKIEVNYNNAVEVSGDSGVGLVDVTDRELGCDSCVEFSDDIIGELRELNGKKCEESPSLGFSSGDVYECRPNNLGSSAYELLNRLGDNLRVGDVTFNDKAIGTVHSFHETGIKGVRPPVLAPPPWVSLPVIDKESSTWDILNSFAPDSGVNIYRHEKWLCLDEEGTEGGGQKRIEGVVDRRRKLTTREENCELSESCSYTTNTNDDDSGSSTTETTPNISPIGILKRNIVDWQKGELLGRGSFGSVYEAIDNVDGHFFAVKEVSLLDQDDEGKQCISQLEQEIALLSQFEHENIVQYYGTTKDESHLYIFLQLVTKGSLLRLYQKYKLQDSQVSVYTRQILHGLKYLHDRNVIHRDIKCANLLVDTLGSVKLADFGLAKTTKLNDVKSCKGTAFWMAPEVVRSRGYGLAADIWSLGCTVLEMLTRRFPYYNLECMPALFKIGRGERPPIPDYLSRASRDFILQCLQVDPSMRPTAAQLLDHPFVRQSFQSSSGLQPHNWTNILISALPNHSGFCTVF